MTSLYSVADVRTIERLAIEEFGIGEPTLMHSAGGAAFRLLQARFVHARTVVVFCGGGNNGGDGYVVSELAALAGMSVTALTVGVQHEQRTVAQDASKAGVKIEPFIASTSIDGLLAKADLIVDAMLGVGLRGDVRGEIRDAISAITRAKKHNKAKVLALDCPSGLDCDTGAVLGVAVRADVTMTFLARKKGLLTGDAVGYVGELFCDELGLPAEAFSHITPSAELIEPVRLAPRARETHKGCYGHVLVIGGECGLSGAPRMAAEGAARVGAGLVSIATRPEHVVSLNSNRPELMVHGVNKGDDVLPLLEKASVVVIGPGLGQQDWGHQLLQAVMACDLPKILDADALNGLAQAPMRRDDWVLTPHPGEAARLLGRQDSRAVQTDRFEAINALQKRYGGVCVLKGAGTLVRGAVDYTLVCDKGNPGMATGGMGDVLSGVIAGLVAQGKSLEDAASTGVLIHAMAADKATLEGGERGLLAMDVVAQLRAVINGLTHD